MVENTTDQSGIFKKWSIQLCDNNKFKSAGNTEKLLRKMSSIKLLKKEMIYNIPTYSVPFYSTY